MEYSSLLIIECDSDKLRSQGLIIGQLMDKIFSDFELKKYKFIRVNTKDDLLSCFAGLSKKKQIYDIVVLIGHSNQLVINVAQNFPVKWDILPNYLKTVKPKCLMLVACEAGGFIPSEAMFKGLLTLKELYGSPLTASDEKFSILIIILFYILPKASIKSLFKDIINLRNKSESDQEQINILLLKISSLFLNPDVKNKDSIMTSINYFKNGGIVLRHTRNSYKKNKILEEFDLYKLLDLFYKK